jgi:hypothetical protein
LDPTCSREIGNLADELDDAMAVDILVRTLLSFAAASFDVAN